MNIFELHQQVIEDYRSFIHSYVNIADQRIRDFVDKQLLEENHLWPDYLLQLSPSYARGHSVKELVQQGILHPEMAAIFCRSDGQPFSLYRHQEEAVRKALNRESFVVTSGTGSGKSLTYFLPIFHHLLTNPTSEGVVALVVYPMNALVNSQYNALKEFEEQYQKRYGTRFPVHFAKYTGETGAAERDKLRHEPPQILLTNYVMAELMLLRPEDEKFFNRDRKALKFLVFDELHTYRGRRGADVALLIRRLRERGAENDLLYIGTSATMVAHPDVSRQERRQTVADFATRFFGYPFTAEQVIEETLERITLGDQPTADELKQAVQNPLPTDIEALRRHPLARWAEFFFGVAPEEPDPDRPEETTTGYRLRRQTPRTLTEGAKQLAECTGETEAICREKLQELFVLGSSHQSPASRLFAFKLHQFISQSSPVLATIGPPDKRALSLVGIYQDRLKRLYFPLRFCRHCGQEYYQVYRIDNRVFPDIDFDDTDPQTGYLMLARPGEEDWKVDYIPEEWYDANGKLRPTWKKRVPTPVWVSADGSIYPSEEPDTVKMWWQSQRFTLCLNCGEFYTYREKEYSKLAILSSEGRSSATTVLATSLLRRARASALMQDKLLTFTDSRQDASLQAGHFNDFVHLAVLRAALVQALKQYQTLTFDTVASRVLECSGLTLRDVAKNANLVATSDQGRDAWRTFQDLTEYRLYEDLRRGWRVLQPNLEQLGLLQINYKGLESLANQTDIWPSHLAIAGKTPEERLEVLRILLDHFRRKRAICVKVFEENFQQQLRRRADQQLNEFWGLDPDINELRPGTSLVLDPKTATVAFRSGSLSAFSRFGRFLQRQWRLTPQEYQKHIRAVVEVLLNYGFLRKKDSEALQLDASALLWQLADGTPPPPDPLYSRRGTRGYVARDPKANTYFQQFYSEAGSFLAALEAREHTAQVVQKGERELRERRFRWDRDRADLDPQLGRRLPYLVCSPTMELGIDIADLDMVHMRNVPPTPANYAQRSGRASRQGQPGLIVTFASWNSPHDQYFFHHRDQMVSGSVRPPTLDLTNETLVRAHLHAMWLAHVRLSLGDSIEQVIDTEQSGLPLRENVQAQIHLGPQMRGLLLRQMQAVLQFDENLLNQTTWYNTDWLEQVIQQAPQEFDKAFDRWRELYQIADDQLRRATESLCKARNRDDRSEAERKQQEALRQRDLLLQQGVSNEESDFYPYRYLATEGFLAGYNFPRLPIRVWVPRGEGEFIARPRALAITELAPGNILYHEGGKWEITALHVPLNGLASRRQTQRFCRRCAYFCETDKDRCPSCDALFDGGNSRVISFLEMPNVKSRRIDRITSEEEQRYGRGYRNDIYYQFAPEYHADSQTASDRTVRLQQADVVVASEDYFQLLYAPTAAVLNLNRGPRKQTTEGFRINLRTGEFKQEDPESPTISEETDVQRLHLAVKDTMNILLIRPKTPLELPKMVTLLYALKAGIEQAFQLEESELDAHLIGGSQSPHLLFIETSEGGSGVLQNLITQNDAFAEVARQASLRCHFSEEQEDLKPDCVAACYECLLSFYNQRYASRLDRHLVRELLHSLKQAQVLPRFHRRDYAAHFQYLYNLTDSRSDLERRFLKALQAGNHRLPDKAQETIPAVPCTADFFYQPNICIFCDGSVHDQPQNRANDQAIRNQLLEMGYRVIVIRYDEPLETQIDRYPDVFGKRR
ncbi:MAG TPA: DEAD/DEAH box helicase [Chthonomonas sp.]|uniref:DEAD/DEAH box helicase n=1 Tax=Chthonomonas sp. TaxID=2282153 RepID=UPI002B4AB3D0|nr:DEAD/DEAH box helicase [Chthonomonas sp.]HLI47342.1 DEAD/DEAH box helicase [Chthonomonas sp.]